MAMKIAILEDNEERCAIMSDYLKDRFYPFESHFFKGATEMIAFLDESLDNTILIGLDHDLEMIPGPDGKLVDPGTGRQVADYLSHRAAVCPVVIHSSNSDAAVGMEMVLQEAHWKTYRVFPVDDREWIAAQWFPTVRRAIVGTAQKPARQPTQP